MVSALPSAAKTFLFLPGKSLDFIRVLTPFFSAERCRSGAAFAFVGPFQEQTPQFKESIYRMHQKAHPSALFMISYQ